MSNACACEPILTVSFHHLIERYLNGTMDVENGIIFTHTMDPVEDLGDFLPRIPLRGARRDGSRREEQKVGIRVDV